MAQISVSGIAIVSMLHGYSRQCIAVRVAFSATAGLIVSLFPLLIPATSDNSSSEQNVHAAIYCLMYFVLSTQQSVYHSAAW